MCLVDEFSTDMMFDLHLPLEGPRSQEPHLCRERRQHPENRRFSHISPNVSVQKSSCSWTETHWWSAHSGVLSSLTLKTPETWRISHERSFLFLVQGVCPMDLFTSEMKTIIVFELVAVGKDGRSDVIQTEPPDSNSCRLMIWVVA